MIAGNELHEDQPECRWCKWVEVAILVSIGGAAVYAIWLRYFS